MRIKFLLATLLLLAGFGLHPSKAQTPVGDPIWISNSIYIVTTGTTIVTVDNNNSAVSVFNSRLEGADGWNLTTTGSGAFGLHTVGNSFFSGTNLIIETQGDVTFGVLAQSNNNTTSLTGGHITTGGTSSHGLYSNLNATITGTNLIIQTSGSNAFGAEAFNGGTISLTGGTITTTGIAGCGITAFRDATIISSNLTIEISGIGGYGILAMSSGTVSFTGGTITTLANSTAGVYAGSGTNTVTIQNTTFNVASYLVIADSTPGYATRNFVTLDTVTFTNGTNVFKAFGECTNTLTVINSKLAGNLAATDGTTINNIILQNNSHLTGASSLNSTSKLHVSVGVDCQWTINGNSALSSVLNSGTLDLRTTDNSLHTLDVSGDFKQLDPNATIAMTLLGTTPVVTVGGSTSLLGTLELAGDLSGTLTDDYFSLFVNTEALTTTFDHVILNGTEVALDGNGTFQWSGGSFTLTYTGDASDGALTGGYDVLLKVVVAPVPEPATWALIAGGLGILIAHQRRRRES